MELSLPAKCFISHAYADAAVVDRLVAKLSPGVPFIFPPITGKPEEIVSNHLIEAILKCDGLIYLRGGKSEESFWVAFERDYALRAGKKVYSFDPVTLQIEPDISSPLDLAVFASYARRDGERVLEISDHLARERFFDIWLDSERVQMGADWNEQITEGIKGSLDRDGYLIAFWSEAAGKSKSVEEEIMLAINATPKNQSGQDRVLFALLEDCPLPPKHLTNPRESPVQIYGDETRSEKNGWTIWLCDCTGSFIATQKTWTRENCNDKVQCVPARCATCTAPNAVWCKCRGLRAGVTVHGRGGVVPTGCFAIRVVTVHAATTGRGVQR